MSGQAYLMDGRNLENTWFRIMLTASRGCWVEASTGSASGDTMKLRVLISPPTPTPTKVVACSNFTDQKTCEAQPICQWKPGLTSAGGCVKK